jgi:tetratricopeptide (TPR) repeat protein
MIDSEGNIKDLPFRDKVDFIFSYNKNTPLFVRKADYELEKKKLDEAVEILTKGIKEFPNYAAPYLLLGKIFALRGDYSIAIENIKKGSDLIHSRKTYGFYLNEIENIKNKISLGFSNDTKIEKEAVKETPKEIMEDESFEKEKRLEPKPLPIDKKLGDLVKEIAPDIQNNLPVERNEQEKSFGKNIIISDTLAKIYISQGEYKEAIDIYNLLKDKHPEKIDYYSKKIEELKSKMD